MGAWETPRLLSCLSFFFCVGMLAGSAGAVKVTEHSCYTKFLDPEETSTVMHCGSEGLTGALLLLLPDEVVFTLRVCLSLEGPAVFEKYNASDSGAKLITILML